MIPADSANSILDDYGDSMLNKNTSWLSRDGRMLAMAMASPNESGDIWIQPTAWQQNLAETPPDITRPPQRLTFLPGSEARPIWSPDATELVFRWDGDSANPRGIYRKQLGGGAETLVRDNHGSDDHPSDWTADGRFLIVTTDTLLASDRNNIISVPRCSPEGDELFFVTATGTLVAVDVEATADAFSFSAPRVLFQSPWRLGGSYDPAPDSEESPNAFIFLDREPPPEAPISLILNWQSLLPAPESPE